MHKMAFCAQLFAKSADNNGEEACGQMSNSPFIKKLERTLGIGLPDNARAHLSGGNIVVVGKDAQGTAYEVVIDKKGEVHRSRYCGPGTGALDILVYKLGPRNIPSRWRGKKVVPFCTEIRNKRYSDDKIVSSARFVYARMLIGLKTLFNFDADLTNALLTS